MNFSAVNRTKQFVQGLCWTGAADLLPPHPTSGRGREGGAAWWSVTGIPRLLLESSLSPSLKCPESLLKYVADQTQTVNFQMQGFLMALQPCPRREGYAARWASRQGLPQRRCVVCLDSCVVKCICVVHNPTSRLQCYQIVMLWC